MSDSTEPPRKRKRWPWAVGGVAFVSFVAGGFFHCVHGGILGFDVIPKEEWGYYDQVVDINDIDGRPWSHINASWNPKTIRALVKEAHLAAP